MNVSTRGTVARNSFDQSIAIGDRNHCMLSQPIVIRFAGDADDRLAFHCGQLNRDSEPTPPAAAETTTRYLWVQRNGFHRGKRRRTGDKERTAHLPGNSCRLGDHVVGLNQSHLRLAGSGIGETDDFVTPGPPSGWLGPELFDDAGQVAPLARRKGRWPAVGQHSLTDLGLSGVDPRCFHPNRQLARAGHRFRHIDDLQDVDIAVPFVDHRLADSWFLLARGSRVFAHAPINGDWWTIPPGNGNLVARPACVQPTDHPRKGTGCPTLSSAGERRHCPKPTIRVARICRSATVDN